MPIGVIANVSSAILGGRSGSGYDYMMDLLESAATISMVLALKLAEMAMPL